MKTTIAAHAAANIRLTTMATKAFNGATSLLCVSTAGREADSAESASAFLEKESAWRPFIPKKRHPAFAGCQMMGVFGVGALLPQFLAELTSTLNSRIWNYHSISARPWQA